ncbi:CBS domain-containing protein [Nocardia speluncae]|uniref:CBS domain-containing protein n=1 Tax=Nocardia speluncae TaxID=419477 RepID=A0A846XAH5_9NOCA|nr:CBS domain-containing protein [Nocardia speluncae]NKY32962.1 CBS domain-containing protein [Nocardia speluncae]
MRHTTVADVMTRDVVSVDVDTPFHHIVQLLTQHGISGVPVLDARHQCIGMVTEADLLARQSRLGGPITGTVWAVLWKKTFARKSEALTAAQLMTAPVITVMSDARVSAAAAILARHDLRCAPVIDPEGAMVGIVGRRDVLAVYLRPDEELAELIQDDVVHRALWLPPTAVSVEVHAGVVTLRGAVEAAMIGLIGSLVAAVDGVVEVRNRLIADTARALMHAGVHSIGAGESVAAAAHRMRADNVGTLLVVDTTGTVTGIVTDRDLVLRCVADGFDAQRTPVEAFATHAVVTAQADQHVDDVVATMRGHRLRRVPILAHGRPVGIVTEADIARRLPRAATGALVKHRYSTRPADRSHR